MAEASLLRGQPWPRSTDSREAAEFQQVQLHAWHRILQAPRREQILEIIRKEPGVPLGAIISRTGLGSGTVYHHLHVLEKHRHVISETVGRRRIFYAVGAGERDPARTKQLALLRGRTVRRIAETVMRNRGCSIQEIIAVTAICPQVAYYHVKRLIGAGLVHRVSQVGYRSLEPDGELADLLASLAAGLGEDNDREADRLEAGGSLSETAARNATGPAPPVA